MTPLNDSVYCIKTVIEDPTHHGTYLYFVYTVPYAMQDFGGLQRYETIV